MNADDTIKRVNIDLQKSFILSFFSFFILKPEKCQQSRPILFDFRMKGEYIELGDLR